MIQSPCVKICTHIDGICIGCYRTVDEIKEWKTYTVEQKKEKIDGVMKELKKREESYINNI